MQLPFVPEIVEERVEEEQSLARLSTETLEYMHEYGTAWEAYLTRHRGNLIFLAESEYDLVEAMRLSARLNNVGTNITRTGRRNERIESELLRRNLYR